MTMYANLGKSTKNLYQSLAYNEIKVKGGQAELLLAENFMKETFQLSKEDKLFGFLQRTSLNERTKKNILNISLNFDLSENISNEQIRVLAKRYMTGMEWEKQPYLVYRHFDSAHTHSHILTTNIRADGSKIKLIARDYRKSHQITRQLQKEFSLSRSERLKQGDGEGFKVEQAQRVEYGKAGLKHSISDVLNAVVDHYRYTSLTELNAILRLYNVKATRGREGSHLYQHRGLLYYAIDENGKQKGKYIKASDFLLKPTLASLERKFLLNASLRERNEQRVKAVIDWTLAGTPPDWKGFQESMEREGMDVVLQGGNKDGPENIFFVDHGTKSVFTGATLGSPYMLETIRQRCALEQSQEQELQERQRHRLHLGL